MRVEETTLPGVRLIEPDVYTDERGAFSETWRAERYPFAGAFVQDNLSTSGRGVLRGLHLQWPKAQGKLVCVLYGEVFDVIADVSPGSPTFRRWEGHVLSADNRRQLWIPPGYAHGFLVTSDQAHFFYKCTEVYDPDCELAIRWDDPRLAIEWPTKDPELSPKDASAPLLQDIDPDRLPG